MSLFQAFSAGADPNTPNFFPQLGPQDPSALGQSFTWDPTRGEILLTKFASLDPSGTSVLSSDDLRQALITALVHNELNAAVAGLVTAIPTEKGPGVVIGAAYQKASQNPSAPGAAAYLANYANVQAALDATRPSNAAPTLSATLSPTQPVAFFVPILLLVAGIAALAAVAYVASTYVESHNDTLSRVARCQQAADLATKHLPVPAGMCPPEPKRGVLSASGVTIPWGAIATGVAVLGGAFVVLSMVKGKSS